MRSSRVRFLAIGAAAIRSASVRLDLTDLGLGFSFETLDLETLCFRGTVEDRGVLTPIRDSRRLRRSEDLRPEGIGLVVRRNLMVGVISLLVILSWILKLGFFFVLILF